MLSHINIDEIEVGDQIHDMHYGLDDVPFECEHISIRWDGATDVVIAALAERGVGSAYCNKMLAVLKIEGTKVWGIYAYDDRHFGFVIFDRGGPRFEDA